jgi:hypothetical protein
LSVCGVPKGRTEDKNDRQHLRAAAVDRAVELGAGDVTRMVDMTNKRVGKLTVLGYAGSKFRGRASRASWHCLCDCGARLVVVGAHLRDGNSKSSGCASRFTSERARLIGAKGSARPGGARKAKG